MHPPLHPPADPSAAPSSVLAPSLPPSGPLYYRSPEYCSLAPLLAPPHTRPAQLRLRAWPPVCLPRRLSVCMQHFYYYYHLLRAHHRPRHCRLEPFLTVLPLAQSSRGLAGRKAPASRPSSPPRLGLSVAWCASRPPLPRYHGPIHSHHRRPVACLCPQSRIAGTIASRPPGAPLRVAYALHSRHVRLALAEAHPLCPPPTPPLPTSGAPRPL